MGLPISIPALRLRKHADYQRAYTAAGKKLHAREMSYFVAIRTTIPARNLHPAELLHGSATPGPRVGLTVGRVLGKAHDRNRIKRRMRAAIAKHAALLGDLQVDIILHPRRTVLNLDWAKLEREVASIFRTVRKAHSPRPGVIHTIESDS